MTPDRWVPQLPDLGKAARAKKARHLPCVELGPKPPGCRCSDGKRTCGAGYGDKGVIYPATHCTPDCPGYVAKTGT